MPPVVLAAGIAAAGTIGGSLLSSSAQKSASSQATQAATSAQNTASNDQLQLGQQSLDLQRQMYNNNSGLQTDMYNNNVGLQTDMYNNNVGLQTGIYNQDFNMLSPYATNGMVASNSVNALLGLPKQAPIKSTVTAPPPLTAHLVTAPTPIAGQPLPVNALGTVPPYPGVH